MKTQAVELQQALQEKQNVSQMVKDWNDKGKEIKKLQADLRAKFQLRRTGNTEEEGINQVLDCCFVFDFLFKIIISFY